jgi:FkbM family methyltransferase
MPAEHLTAVEQKVFHYLEDELSRRVFLGRKLVSEHSDTSLLVSCASGLDNTDLLAAIGQRDYYCYGNGNGKLCGLGYFATLVKGTPAIKQCLGVFDRNPDLWDRKSEFLDVEIFPAPTANPRVLCIITVLRKEFVSQIHGYLLSIGVSEENILVFADYLKVSKEQYFDPVLTARLTAGEVFLDCGSYDFATSLELLRVWSGVNKIYAFEPDEVMFDQAAENCRQFAPLLACELIKAGVYSRNGRLLFESLGIAGNSRLVAGNDDAFNQSSDGNLLSIDVVRIDDVIPESEKITFIKMDIEGSELDALKGAARVIVRDKPKLAICVYHKLRDYIDIPLFCRELVPEYKMYLRHYSNENAETVLYCVL